MRWFFEKGIGNVKVIGEIYIPVEPPPSAGNHYFHKFDEIGIHYYSRMDTSGLHYYLRNDTSGIHYFCKMDEV